MGMIDKVLLPGERVESRVSYGGVTIAASSRGIFIAIGSSVTVVPPRHVHAITVTRSLKLLIIGLLVILLGVPFAFALAEIEDDLGLFTLAFSLLVGPVLAIYGYLRRYKLTMSFAGGTVTLKGGGQIPEAAKQIRRLVEL